LNCKELLSKPFKVVILVGLLAILLFAFPTPGAFVLSDEDQVQVAQSTVQQAALVSIPNPAVLAIAAILDRYKVDDEHRTRAATAIVTSSQKYNVDPRLVASIMIVESRANPFAISSKESIGIMQIHLPTWGQTADREGINLFKIEDNVDFGVRILKGYVRQYGLWEGVKRYKGWKSESPESTQSAEEYLQKIQGIYSRDKQ
jgi:soluble lytic murein transglycosylase-like protein